MGKIKFIARLVGLPLGFTLLYLAFPTSNSSSDAMGYATASEIGAHHLLYDQLVSWVNAACHFVPLRTLAVMKILLAIAAGFTLFFANSLFQKIQPKQSAGMVLVMGATFGFMRFATENEVYILPLLFAVISTHFLWLSQEKKRIVHLTFAFVFLAIAVLFHQSYVFWFVSVTLALCFQRQFPKSTLAIPVIMGLLVMGIHILAAQSAHMTFTNWILHDAKEGLVDLQPGLDNFKFTGIGVVRTFVQVHGNIPYLLRAYPGLWAVAILATLMLVFAAYGFFKTIRKDKNNSFFFTLSISLAFIFQLAFAWFSVGNAEFMVMLPFLGLLIFTFFYAVKNTFWLSFGAGILLWNMCFAILPSHYIDYENTTTLHAIMKKKSPCIYISNNKTHFENHNALLCDTGKSIPCNLQNLNGGIILMKSPADGGDTMLVMDLIQGKTSLGNATNIYTDCIEYPEPLNRHKLVSGQNNARFFSKFNTALVDSFTNFYGTVKVWKLNGLK